MQAVRMMSCCNINSVFGGCWEVASLAASLAISLYFLFAALFCVISFSFLILFISSFFYRARHGKCAMVATSINAFFIAVRAFAPAVPLFCTLGTYLQVFSGALWCRVLFKSVACEACTNGCVIVLFYVF